MQVLAGRRRGRELPCLTNKQGKTKIKLSQSIQSLVVEHKEIESATCIKFFNHLPPWGREEGAGEEREGPG